MNWIGLIEKSSELVSLSPRRFFGLLAVDGIFDDPSHGSAVHLLLDQAVGLRRTALRRKTSSSAESVIMRIGVAGTAHKAA